MNDDKEIRCDAKLKNLPPAALDELWRYRYPETEEGDEDAPPKKLPLEEIVALCPKRFGCSTSLGSLSEFYKWLRVKRRIDRAAADVETAKLEWAAKNPGASVDELNRHGQVLFTARAIAEDDAKLFMGMKRLQQSDDARALEREKLTASAKSDAEKGLDALYQEVKGNKKAEALVRELQETVKKQ